MGGKQRLGSKKLRIADVLHHRPGDGQAVEGTGSSADLIENDQAVLRRISQNIGNLGHLHHEGALAGCQIIGGAHPGKDSVTDTDIGFICRYEAAQLRHQND